MPLIVLGSEGAPDMRDNAPEHGSVDGLRAGHIHLAGESQEIHVVNRDSPSMGKELP